MIGATTIQAPSQHSDSSENAVLKKQKRLEQNRLSALKCRRKKKQEVELLKEQNLKFELENSKLKDEVSSIPPRMHYVIPGIWIKYLTNFVQLAEKVKELELKTLEITKLKEFGQQQTILTSSLLNMSSQSAPFAVPGVTPTSDINQAASSSHQSGFQPHQSVWLPQTEFPGVNNAVELNRFLNDYAERLQ